MRIIPGGQREYTCRCGVRYRRPVWYNEHLRAKHAVDLCDKCRRTMWVARGRRLDR